MLEFNVIKLSETSSTNDALQEIIKTTPYCNEGTCVQSLYQTQGRGQMGATWQASPGKNLLFSLLLKPKHTKVDSIFYLNMTLCLSIWKTIHSYHDSAKIKWPNDILINQKKCAGILIETALQNNLFQHIIAGIGVNVNEENFPELIKATSLKQISGREILLDDVLHSLFNSINYFYPFYLQMRFNHIWQMYNDHLFGKGEILCFKDQEGSIFNAEVLGVNKLGQLELKTEGKTISYANKEVEWLY